MTNAAPKTDPVAALRTLGVDRPVWAKEPPEIGYTRAGAREWRYSVTFLSTTALVPIIHLIADGWSVIIDRATSGLVVRFSKS